MSGQSSTNLVGHTLAGRYKLDHLLGQGGMGTVYRAVDAQMSDRVVAVKVLAPHLVSDEKQVMRFEQEARAANQLRHPNTISVLDFGRDSAGHIFMVIEFLTGDTLTGALRSGRMDIARCLYIFRQVCKSLAEAHAKSIVHRDLKPDNIFVCEIYGESDFVKVIDFGIAKFLEDENAQLTQAGKMFGTPRYLSPEQAQGKKLDNRSDLYSLGVIMFECITGRPPFVADEPIAVAIKHVQEPAPHMEDVATDIRIPAAVDRLVFKLLAKSPNDRYQSAEEVVAAIDQAMMALQQAGSGLPVGHYTPHAAMTPARPSTIPPASADDDATRAMAAISDPLDEATRAMEPVAPQAHEAATRFIGAMADDDDATRALEPVSAARAPAPSPPRPSQDATVALSPVDAMNVLKQPEPQVAVQAKGGGGARIVAMVVVGLLVIGGGIFAALQASDSRAEAAAKEAKVAAELEAAKKERKREAAERRADRKRLANERKKREALKKKLAAEKALARVHTVTIESTPAGASVFVGGMEVGKTPYPLKLSMRDADRVLKLKLAGYIEHSVHVKSKVVVETRIDRLPSVLKPVAAPKPATPKPTAPKKKKKKKALDWGM
ncbi:MAG: protein kinase [Myxococcales bacterium]|nr:protein kinase [Myxococcales bacterium]